MPQATDWKLLSWLAVVHLRSRSYERARPTDLSGWLFAAAITLFIADCLAMLYLTGAAARLTKRGAVLASVSGICVAVLI